MLNLFYLPSSIIKKILFVEELNRGVTEEKQSTQTNDVFRFLAFPDHKFYFSTGEIQYVLYLFHFCNNSSLVLWY